MAHLPMKAHMDDPFYTLATWQVRPGEEAAFEDAWQAMGTAFGAVPGAPPVTGTLLRRVDPPDTFVSFGAWPSLEAITRMRADPGAQAAIQRVLAHCTSADPGSYTRVATSEAPAGPPA